MLRKSKPLKRKSKPLKRKSKPLRKKSKPSLRKKSKPSLRKKSKPSLRKKSKPSLRKKSKPSLRKNKSTNQYIFHNICDSDKKLYDCKKHKKIKYIQIFNTNVKNIIKNILDEKENSSSYKEMIEYLDHEKSKIKNKLRGFLYVSFIFAK